MIFASCFVYRNGSQYSSFRSKVLEKGLFDQSMLVNMYMFPVCRVHCGIAQMGTYEEPPSAKRLQFLLDKYSGYLDQFLASPKTQKRLESQMSEFRGTVIDLRDTKAADSKIKAIMNITSQNGGQAHLTNFWAQA